MHNKILSPSRTLTASIRVLQFLSVSSGASAKMITKATGIPIETLYRLLRGPLKSFLKVNRGRVGGYELSLGDTTLLDFLLCCQGSSRELPQGPLSSKLLTIEALITDQCKAILLKETLNESERPQ